MPNTSCTQERKEKGSEKAKKEKEPEVKQLAPGFKEGEKAGTWASGFRLICWRPGIGVSGCRLGGFSCTTAVKLLLVFRVFRI